MALAYSDIEVEYRESVLHDKPPPMLQASPKGAVPVMVLSNGTVMDESYNVMGWALQHHDPDQWWRSEFETENVALRV